MDNRDAFEEMIRDSKQEPPPVKAIVVWDWSRFSRDELESQFYSADLRLRGYQIVSIKDDVPSGEFGPIFESFIRWKNSRYLRDLQAATIRGLDAVVNDRVVIDGVERTGFSGGGLPPRGYVPRVVETGIKPSGKPITRTVWEKTADPELRTAVELAWRMAIEAAREVQKPPIAEIHRLCRIYNDTSSYYDMLRTITYTGTRQVGKRRVDGAHEAYISPEDFELVQRALEVPMLKAVHPRRIASPFPLSGRVFCGYCGSPINLDHDNRRKDGSSLRCSRRKNDPKACTLRKLSYSLFMNALMDALKEEILTDSNVDALVAAMNDEETLERIRQERLGVEAEVSKLDEVIGRLMNAIEAGTAPEPLMERIAQRRRERQELVAKLSAMPTPARTHAVVRREEVQGLVQELRKVLDEADEGGEGVKTVLQGIIARIEITNDSGRVVFSLPLRGYDGYPVGDSNARNWLRRPVLYPLS